MDDLVARLMSSIGRILLSKSTDPCRCEPEGGSVFVTGLCPRVLTGCDADARVARQHDEYCNELTHAPLAGLHSCSVFLASGSGWACAGLYPVRRESVHSNLGMLHARQTRTWHRCSQSRLEIAAQAVLIPRRSTDFGLECTSCPPPLLCPHVPHSKVTVSQLEAQLLAVAWL